MKKLRYLAEALAIKLFWLIFKSLPLDTASNIAGSIARNIGPHLGVSKVARRNLDMALPHLPPDPIIKDMWENLGRVSGEFPHILSCSKEIFYQHLEIIGAEYLEEIRANRKPVVFFSAHLGNWEVSPRIISDYGIDISLIYRAANNIYVDELINRERSQNKVKINEKGNNGLRQIIKEIKDGNSVAMLVDQKMNNGMKVPFFGMDAMTAPAIAKIAASYGTPLVPMQVIRKKATNFKVIIHPAIIAKDEDSHSLLSQINQIIEGWIRENPSQWFWVHNRWGKLGRTD